jgi:hypothetical protein
MQFIKSFSLLSLSSVSSSSIPMQTCLLLRMNYAQAVQSIFKFDRSRKGWTLKQLILTMVWILWSRPCSSRNLCLYWSLYPGIRCQIGRNNG